MSFKNNKKIPFRFKLENTFKRNSPKFASVWGVFGVHVEMKQPTQSNRASKSADKISRKSESLNGAFVPPIKTASVRPLSLSAKVVEVSGGLNSFFF
jgi:hypothetical protein